MTTTAAVAVRGGDATSLPASEIVPGDVLLLAEGDLVPADARIVEASVLQVAVVHVPFLQGPFGTTAGRRFHGRIAASEEVERDFGPYRFDGTDRHSRSMASPGLVVDEQEPFARAALAANGLRDATGVDSHDVAVILGSGWAGAADRLGTVVADVELSSLPGFPEPRVRGHRDLVRSIVLDKRRLLVFGGRSHLYEGISPSTVVHGVRTAAAVGCRTILLTNAAGSLRPTWPVGRVVMISDHLNLTGRSPMVGPDLPSTVPSRFCDLTDAYSLRLRGIVRSVDADVPEGVYAGLLGGNYETPAEIEMLRSVGADLVGMSTVLEAIAARHLGLEVLALSLVTNLAAGLSASPLSHQEVLTTASEAEGNVITLIRAVLEHEDFMP